MRRTRHILLHPEAPAWSIGIYLGDSPLQVAVSSVVRNPVLSRHDVSDRNASFVADPFMVAAGGTWFMFFEVFDAQKNKGVIGMATSEDALRWEYSHVVLDEPFHVSYPYVFKCQDDYYMVPETLASGSTRLYRADPFPTRWSCLGTIVEGHCADPSPFYWDHTWWLFICTPPGKNSILRLYYADQLTGPWKEHPRSPVVRGNPHIARPAGRVVIWNGSPIRFTQDCLPRYGIQVRAFRITDLTRTSYGEQPAGNKPVLAAGSAFWHNSRMHHLDPHCLPTGSWIACVDGCPKESQIRTSPGSASQEQHR